MVGGKIPGISLAYMLMVTVGCGRLRLGAVTSQKKKGGGMK